MHSTIRGALTALIVIVSVAGCATMFTAGGSEYRQAERRYEEGVYQDAVEFSIAALDKNPEFTEARELLDRALETGTRSIESEIAELEASDNPFAYDTIYLRYEKLHELHRTVASSAYASEFDVQDYSTEIASARETAAEAHYQAGVDALEAGDFRSAREAAQQFRYANGIVDGYKDAAALEDRALELAKVTVLVHVPQEDAEIFGEFFARGVITATGADAFTEVVDASAVGLDSNATFEQIVNRLAGTEIDFVLSVDGNAAGDSYGPTTGEPTEFYPDTVGYPIAVGYTATLSGSFELYEAAAQETVASGPYETTDAAEIAMRVFEPTTQIERALHTDGGEVSGTFSALETTTDATGTDWASSEIGEVISETGFPYALDGHAVCIPDTDLDELRNADFNGLKTMLDGKAILPGVEALLIKDYATIAVYSHTDHYEGEGRAVMEEFSAKATAILDYFRENSGALAQEAAQATGRLSAGAAQTIGQEIAPILR